jgi:hypothetical protein
VRVDTWVLLFRAFLEPGEHPGLHVVVQRVGDEEVQRADEQIDARDTKQCEPDEPRPETRVW